ncbi:MAG: APC family permease [Woeseiaceae bacterium]
MSETSHHLKRSLGVTDMTLFTVSAILLLDTLSASASIGVSSITWWVILSLLFFVPYGLISAELGTTYPEQGGIYAWVRDAFGARWGTRVTWLYWLNNVLWHASLYVLFAGIFAQMFFPDLSAGAKLIMALALTWLVIGLTTLSLSIGKWIPNVGAIVKLIAFAALIAGGITFAMSGDGTLANDFSIAAFTPEWGSSTQYISTIIYGVLGFELMSSASEEMKNPQRDVPRSILLSGAIIFVAYILGTFAILAAIPIDQIDLVEGLVDTFQQLFGTSSVGKAAALLLGTMVLVTIISNALTWSIGANRAAAEAAIDGELPRFLAKENKAGAPVGAAISMGILITLVLLSYGLMSASNEDLFWSLFAASAVLFLLPYIGAVGAFFYARIHDANKPRPFRVAGGTPFALVITVVCIGILALSTWLFMYVPGEGFDMPVVIGSAVAILLGEIVIRYAEK